ncbi:PTS system protein [Agrilactobacillus composti DSM 18527 = JCM 14202]|uniref:PTS system protein n=1 Tax=Agrilactobacillus composti DSM 18527 = JCM 14202 TaxID=1423734 RepID=X0PD92_9LACO|nr:fructose PTS transporter subunit IIA [Agrilactobacillus composti]KRM34922.1 PTS system protein [Agrilactobacillus composti DSM 18527 = JCM 14202]GAF38808.1 PTS system, galactose-inducible IIA component [Agrilactobacillus composti DSM 18527 = JCM 14202]
MDATIFNQDHILLDTTSTTQAEAFQAIADLAASLGYVSDAKAYAAGLKEREAGATTGFKDGFAIPHSNDASILKPGLFLVKFSHPIEWAALDNQPVTVALALTIPKDGGKEHLKLLSQIARKLMNAEFRTTIQNETDAVALASSVNRIQ